MTKTLTAPETQTPTITLALAKDEVELLEYLVETYTDDLRDFWKECTQPNTDVPDAEGAAKDAASGHLRATLLLERLQQALDR